MLLALMNKAREVGDHEVKPADTVVGMFRKQNAHRAKQNFQSRSAIYKNVSNSQKILTYI